jgi:hypothetical protein
MESFASRLKKARENMREFDELQKEVLTGRDFYDWKRPDYRQMAQEKLLASGGNPQDPAQLKETARGLQSSAGTLPVSSGTAHPKTFVFEELPELRDGQSLFVRFRLYSSAGLDEAPRHTVVGLQLTDGAGEALGGVVPKAIKTGRFYTEEIPAAVLEGRKQLGLGMLNLDHTAAVRQSGQPPAELVIQAQDGPFLLLGQTSFAVNFWRCILLISLFVAFLAIVGTVAGLCFSTPVALLLSMSYVIAGLSISSVLQSRFETQLAERGSVEYGPLELYFATLKRALVSVETFSRLESLSSGRSLSRSSIAKVFFYEFILKGLPLVFLGVYAIKRRELGMVIRK